MYDVLIKNGMVFQSQQGTFEKKDLLIQDGLIAQPRDTMQHPQTVIDARGKYVLPGLIDEHLHLDLNGSMIGANGILYVFQIVSPPPAMAEPAEFLISPSSTTATSSAMRPMSTPTLMYLLSATKVCACMRKITTQQTFVPT